MSLKAYLGARRALSRAKRQMVPYFRRVMRFLCLPRYYFGGIAWDECPLSRLRVFCDMLYIFFKLKYYPDNYSRCRLWAVDRSRWHLYYGSLTDPYQRRALEREVQPPEYRVVFADKEICHHLCTSLGLRVPNYLGCIGPSNNVASILEQRLADCASGRMIAKPALGIAGRDVFFITSENGFPVAILRDKRIPLGEVILTERFIIQEAVEQHPDLSVVYPTSVNTIRMQTLLTLDGESIVLGALIRFGRNRSRVDNLGAGGIGVGVNLDLGTLMPFGRDASGKAMDRHPESAVRFDGYPVPYWNEVLALAKRAQRCFPFYRLLGFDIAVTPDGPLIIEINPQPHSVHLEAIQGPLLARNSNILEFDRYGLLINQPTRALAASLRASITFVEDLRGSVQNHTNPFNSPNC